MVIYHYLGHVQKFDASMMHEVFWRNDNDQQQD
jgi:hypothetical protein